MSAHSPGKGQTIDRELCEAYRKGCQELLNSRMIALSDKIQLTDEKVALVDRKLDLLKANEVNHLEAKLEQIRKEKREPLGKKEWTAIFSALIAALASIVVALVK